VVHGRQTVALHTGPLTPTALWWRALWEVGACAVLDGVSALQASGVRGLDTAAVQVSVPRDFRRPRVTGVRQRRVGHGDDDVVRVGVPRVRPALAAIRAASWAVSNRQAALILVLPVQQRVVLGEHLMAASLTRNVRDRRGLIERLSCDIADGAQSLGELDFAALCRARGLPEPGRQVVQRSARGRIYLDVRWPAVGLVVEIDGSGHRTGLAVTLDNLRQNQVAISGDTVLRIDLVGLRLETDAFLDQVVEAYRVLSLRRAG
jgi:very-short-patch-repair endonuclease